MNQSHISKVIQNLWIWKGYLKFNIVARTILKNPTNTNDGKSESYVTLDTFSNKDHQLQMKKSKTNSFIYLENCF